jgi:methanogenic corrinoid protein MtbC1
LQHFANAPGPLVFWCLAEAQGLLQAGKTMPQQGAQLSKGTCMSEQSSTATNARVPLQRALQQVVIPGLVNRRMASPPGTEQSLKLSAADLTRLAQASLLNAHAIETELGDLLSTGWPLDRVYLDAIAGTARLLGQWWTSDQLDFASLTIATARLQDVVRHWESRFLRSASPLTGAHQFQVLLLNEFNDQHSLGMLMLQSFFKRDGWRVPNTWGMQEDALLAQVESSQVHLVGLSICTDRRLPSTRRLIDTLRERSLNPDLLIMLGGPLVLNHPELVEDLGADWLAGHADQASRDAWERVSEAHAVRRTA